MPRKEKAMAKKFFCERNLKFLLYAVFAADALTRHKYYSEHSKKSFDLVLSSAIKIAKDLLYPMAALLFSPDPMPLCIRMECIGTAEKYL